MDPFSALGAAAAIAQFVELSFNIISGAYEVYKSTSGMSGEDEQLGFVMTAMSSFSSKIKGNEDLANVAKRCEDLASTLLQILERTKAKDPSSLRQSAVAALRSKWNAKEKQELKNQVNECRDLLHFELTLIMRSDTMARLQEIAKNGKANSDDLASIQRHTASLRQGVHLGSLSPEAKSQMTEIFQLTEEALRTITNHRILNAISFPEIHKRFGEVTQADSDTFQWVFENPPPQKHQKAMEGRMLFTDWLKSGNGIFHIAAKPGAGKSTLMKFIVKNSEAKNLLRNWANGRTLITGKFFFWLPGSEMQNSIPALLQTLLFDVLEQCPDLIPMVFSKQWSRLESLPWQAPVSLTLDKDELFEAFDRLINYRDHNEKRCFCFFIDGLDELHQTDHVTYKHLAKVLSRWAQNAPDALKLCVSSREDNVFLDNFSSFMSFKLQDLTYDDMFTFVRKKLEANQNFRDMEKDTSEEKFFSQIVSKADGVFLWMTLVANLLDDTCDSEYDFSELKQRLEWTHPEIEKLIQQLLSSIHSLEKNLSAQTFAMVLESNKGTGGKYISLFRYSFLDDYNNDPEFATKITLEEGNCLGLERLVNIERCLRVTRKRLYARCKGLIEVKAKGRHEFADGRSNLYISYSHRTIPEFLLRKDIEQERLAHLDGFNPLQALVQTFAAEIALNSQIEEGNPYGIYGFELYDILHLVLQRETGYEEAIQTLRHVDRIVGRRSTKHSKLLVVSYLTSVIDSDSPDFRLVAFGNVISIGHCAAAFGISDYFLLDLQPMIHYDYVKNHTLLIPTLLIFPFARGLDQAARIKSYSSKSKIVRCIFQNGGNPNQTVEYSGDISNAVSLNLKVMLREALKKPTWWHLLVYVMFVSCKLPVVQEMVEAFLEFGADPHISFVVKYEEEEDRVAIIRIYDTPKASSDGTALAAEYFSEWVLEDDFMANFINSKGGKASLRDIVEFRQPPNMQALLSLIDRQPGQKASIHDGTLVSDVHQCPPVAEAEDGLQKETELEMTVTNTTGPDYQPLLWKRWWDWIIGKAMLTAALGIFIALIGALFVSKYT